MRRFLRKRILENLTDLFNKHKEMELAYAQQNYEEVQLLLAQCQEQAIWVGNTLEESGELREQGDAITDGGIIRQLEMYCEALFWQAMRLGENEKEKCSFAEALDPYIHTVKTCVEEQIQERLEIAFFPYKASMWDSLESIWMAAEEDLCCDAFVVPIPYFDRNADGSIGAMHYEGEEFPEYVPVLRWTEYDVAERHPDIVYIHNPYDNANKVTVVHMDFFARELKKHTDLLVYVPYFVCLENVPEHFCVLPGTLHADKVIVQSEKVRETYIREFHRCEEENHCRDRFGVAEEKFVALGSPKYDKTLNTTRENVNLPEAWKKKIIREDGSWRRILLYNTGVSKLMESKEGVIKKIASVFQMVKNREDTVLIWRPHPLSESTCMSISSQLAKEYQRLVEEYRREDWGIYDDTPELERAIAISDAYYGDGSSLVELCLAAGKLVMMQDVKVL